MSSINMLMLKMSDPIPLWNALSNCLELSSLISLFLFYLELATGKEITYGTAFYISAIEYVNLLSNIQSPF